MNSGGCNTFLKPLMTFTPYPSHNYPNHNWSKPWIQKDVILSSDDFHAVVQTTTQNPLTSASNPSARQKTIFMLIQTPINQATIDQNHEFWRLYYSHYTKCADCLYALHEVCGLSIPDWYRTTIPLWAAYSNIRALSVRGAFPKR